MKRLAAVEKTVVGPPVAAPKGIETILLAPGVIIAIANALSIVVQAIENRYERMDDKNKGRADTLLLNAGERVDRVFAWIDRQVFGEQPQ